MYESYVLASSRSEPVVLFRASSPGSGWLLGSSLRKVLVHLVRTLPTSTTRVRA